ncbi:globin [Fibrella aestuarina BUZ 2]|uniref:Globin n=1 Tax=Fibrella aestuarina BUZ 2 TaxID=1166018 RepID=I0K6A6_9BACT|nr:globin domain-containing protein [Fibrella aestuarina]CCG99659.1 globin [Fibrella aestuarina BUZ 2]
MTSQQIDLVKQTGRLLWSIDPALIGDVFYSRLALQYPQVRALFKGPLDVQYGQFADMLNIIVARLDRPGEVAVEIADMTRWHEAYGVQPAHYAAVGEVLLWTLEQGLGKQWNADVRDAWLACYQELSQQMLARVYAGGYAAEGH